MAALGCVFPVLLCLLMTHRTWAKNEAPCQLSKWNNGFNTFKARHVRTGTPNTDDRNEWYEYIKNLGGCNRPTQSFLKPSDLDKVKAVCSSTGGKVYKENLCISEQPFSFFTVRSEVGTCGIKSVSRETKHLILACELLENQCLPVHFEGNPTNDKPSNNARGCQDPRKSEASRLQTPLLWLLSVTLLFIYWH